MNLPIAPLSSGRSANRTSTPESISFSRKATLRETVELSDNEFGLVLHASGQRRIQLRSLRTLAGLDLTNSAMSCQLPPFKRC
jgi:hypothetical protein